MLFLAVQRIQREHGCFQFKLGNQVPYHLGLALLAVVKGLLVYHQAALVSIHLHQGRKVLVAL